MLKIINKGQAITSTNYWDSEHARRGLVFLSWNAGAARILLPDSNKTMLREMRTAKYVIISRGPWMDKGVDDALEIMFEDGTHSPFSFHLVAEMTDRMLPEDNQGGGFTVTVWTRGGEKLRLPGKYRVVSAIPCLEPWNAQ